MFATTLLELDGSRFIAEKDSIKSVNVPKSITDFLSRTSTSTVLVGQKGTGKSILLSYKKYNDSERTVDSKTFIFPKSAGVEEINFDGELGVKPLLPLSVEDWEKIFIIAIQYYLFCQLRETIVESKFISNEIFESQEVHKYLNPHNLEVRLLQFGNILHNAIEQRICYKDLNAFRNLVRSVIIGGVIEINKNSIYYYLDGLDQAIYKAIHRSEKDELNGDLEIEYFLNFEGSIFDGKEEKNSRQTNKVHLWIKAQLGFLKALHHLNELNRSAFKIYGSIRYEAYTMLEQYNLINLPQLKSTCKVISYNKEELIEIFDKLIIVAGVDKKDFKKFEINELIHNKVKNRPYNKETIEEHILRHTLGNPREITYQVLAIKSLFDSKTLKIGEAVANTASLKEKLGRTIVEIKKDLETETLPSFPSKALIYLINEFQKNYIPREKVSEQHIKRIAILYRLGLVGVLKREANNSFIQYFLEKNIYFQNSSVKLPESPFYLLHPVLDPLLFDNYGHDAFYYPYCIIGHGLPFVFLKEEEYYLPANLLEDNLSGDLKKVKDIFCKYYRNENALELYKAISDIFYAEWGNKILSYYLLNEGNLTTIKEVFFDKLSGNRVFLTIDNSVREDISALRRTYKLRMIVGLIQACKLFDEKTNRKLYEERLKFKDRSFFNNIRNSNPAFDKLDKFWSKFELDCLRECLELFNKNHYKEIEANEFSRSRFTKLLSIIPTYK